MRLPEKARPFFAVFAKNDCRGNVGIWYNTPKTKNLGGMRV
jgi:hypothetical protein